MSIDASKVPRTNLRGLRDHWRNDAIAGLSVALVALPLALGIAMAAGAPPISGLVSVAVAGFIGTFVRGTHVAINGPGNSLIVIVASAFLAFGGGAEAFPHVLGAIVVAGAVQVLFGLLRLGRVGDVIPSAVIQGMLAAIGLIIVGKQLHVLLGQKAAASNPIGVFQELPATVATLDPFVSVLGVISLAILILHPKTKRKFVRFIPAPLWVVSLAVGVIVGVQQLGPRVEFFEGLSVAENLRVRIPADLIGSLVRPDFSRIGEAGFWMVVMTFTLVNSIENIVSVKAVDRLDPYRRESSMNRDLVGMGVSTIASGMLGGLPVLTVIARSSVNLNHGAKTGWSNFFQGLLLSLCVLLISPVMQLIPLSALAAILIYTGYKLAGPHVVRETLNKGPDHFLIFGVTLTATLVWGLLWGIFIGLVAELVSHLIILNLPARESLVRLWQTSVETVHEEGKPYLLRVRGVANYLMIPRLQKALQQVSGVQNVIVDFTQSLLVDHTLLEFTHEFGRRYERENAGGRFDVLGLEAHRAISDHPDALHVIEGPLRTRRLTPRQKKIEKLAAERTWEFDARRVWDPDDLGDFRFFRLHPVEYRDTVVRGVYELGGEAHERVEFSLCDVTFDEGVVIPEVYHTTAQVLHLPMALPELIVEKEELLDRVLQVAGFRDADFEHFTDFSRRFVVKGEGADRVREFLSDEVLAFLEEEEVYHLECNGTDLVVFKFMRLATPPEVEAMLTFSERLTRLLVS
jgi:MFS superfamily sulfate permease-like transporter